MTIRQGNPGNNKEVNRILGDRTAFFLCGSQSPLHKLDMYPIIESIKLIPFRSQVIVILSYIS